MKRLAALILAIIVVATLAFASCDKITGTSNSPGDPSTNSTDDIIDPDSSTTSATTIAPENRVINVYSPTDEVPRIIMKYMELHPEIDYKVNMFTFATADMAFQVALDHALAAGGSDAPDIYSLEIAQALKYSQGEQAHYASPYKDLGIDVDTLAKDADIAQYSLDIGTNPEGEIVGLGYQGTGGAFIYRRSIAKSVWGTDDPAIIGYIIGPGWDRFFEAAADLKAQGYGIVSGDGDIWHSIENSADKPWIVDGKLHIDPKREAFLDYAKLLQDNGFSNNTRDWSDEWFADMKGTGQKEIFGFFGPSWLINYVMLSNCGGEKPGEGTYGDWAVCEPPAAFFWSGNWIFANKNSKHKEVIGDILEWITLDSSETGLQHSWANGTYDVNNPVLDTVTSGTVMKKATGTLDFLGNQKNMYVVFDIAAKQAKGNNKTQYDEMINSYWREQVREYTAGSKSREQAINDFKKAVGDNLDIGF